MSSLDRRSGIGDAFAVAATLLALACSPRRAHAESAPIDGGFRLDAGPESMDAAFDAGPGIDAGARSDAGPETMDTAPVDAAPAIDAAPEAMDATPVAPDAGAAPPPPGGMRCGVSAPERGERPHGLALLAVLALVWRRRQSPAQSLPRGPTERPTR